MGKDKMCVQSGMAFTAGAFRPLRRSAGAKTAICMVAINPRNPGGFPEKEFTPVVPEKALPKQDETEEDLDATRRDFLRVGVSSVIGGWVVSGMIQDFLCNTMYNLSATMDGKLINMSSYRGKVVMVVNVASNSSLTPQYEELATLYDKYSAKGFEVLAFPCDQFGNQEPGTREEIVKMAKDQYAAEFPIFDKVSVNGTKSHALFEFLKTENPDSAENIEWNFTKFLVDKNGHAVGRYDPGVLPSMLEKDVKRLLEGRQLKKRRPRANSMRYDHGMVQPVAASTGELPANRRWSTADLYEDLDQIKETKKPYTPPRAGPGISRWSRTTQYWNWAKTKWMPDV
uniref:Glutathione peroxidase n=2 Tax=Rhodosorus marinus TaxID=101924 RepID=A0A7S3A850_9RHOD